MRRKDNMNLDVLIIRGSSAGDYAAEATLKNSNLVGIAEKAQIGGDCIFHACVLTKAPVYAA